MARPLGSLKTKYVSISKCFLLHHAGFFNAGFAQKCWRRCMHAILLKQGLSLLGRFSITPANRWRNINISIVVRLRAIAFFVGQLWSLRICLFLMIMWESTGCRLHEYESIVFSSSGIITSSLGLAFHVKADFEVLASFQKIAQHSSRTSILVVVVVFP